MKQPTLPTSSASYPIGSRVILVDAWMRHPIEVKITKHWNAEHIGAEDANGIVYYAHTSRIRQRIVETTDFDDILGDAPKPDDFDDILG